MDTLRLNTTHPHHKSEMVYYNLVYPENEFFAILHSVLVSCSFITDTNVFSSQQTDSTDTTP
jgi:hypothetical protein